MGLGALCNACRIWLRPTEALREVVHVHLPPPATVISESPTTEPAPTPEKKQKRKRGSRRILKSHRSGATTRRPARAL